MVSSYGDWIIQGPLGEGGQAHTFTCYKADDPAHVLRVLKRLKNRERIARFVAEVDAIKKLQSPYVVQIVAFDTEHKSPYLIMPYYSKGEMARHSLAGMSTIERLRMFMKICRGVGCAHSIGIVHRDVKPDNIFISESGDPVVGDFGICHVVDGERFTLTEEAVGPFRYMAPELEDGRLDDVSAAADVYSLGKLLYWMLTDRTLAREKHREAAFNLATQDAPSEMHLVYELLDRMIVTEPTARLSDANAVCNELNALIERVEMRAHAIGPDVPQHCLYCGKGHYRVAVDVDGANAKPMMTVQNFGFTTVGNSQWRITVCDYCGNTQLFRLDLLPDRRNPWIATRMP